MAKQKSVKSAKNVKIRKKPASYDGVFAFKLALYVVLGTMWVKVTDGQVITFPLPVGLILGMIFTSHEHFAIDRKIEYAVLMVAALIGFFAPFGIYISL